MSLIRRLAEELSALRKKSAGQEAEIEFLRAEIDRAKLEKEWSIEQAPVVVKPLNAVLLFKGRDALRRAAGKRHQARCRHRRHRPGVLARPPARANDPDADQSPRFAQLSEVRSIP